MTQHTVERTADVFAVISNKPRSYKGAASNDTFHFQRKGETRTLCGRDASDWMKLETEQSPDSAYCCTRCRAALSQVQP